MGFHLRKTFNLGGLRINLSNSGIGFSAGIKGFHAGIDGKGRSYIGGGKGILRYREFAKTKNKDSKITSRSEDKEKIILPNSFKVGMRAFCVPLMFFAAPFLLILVLSFFVELFSKQKIDYLMYISAFLFFSLPFLSLKHLLKCYNAQKAIKCYNDSNYEKALEYYSNLFDRYIFSCDQNTKDFIIENICDCYSELNEYEKAVTFLKQNSYYSDINYKIIQIYFHASQYQKVVDYYINNLGTVTDLRNLALFFIYLSFQEIKDYKKCIDFLLSRKDSFDMQQYKQYMVKTYQQAEMWEELIYFMQKEYTYDEKQNNPSYYAILAEAFLNTEQKEIALETLLQGPVAKRTMNEQMCEFRYILGKCYEANGDIENALKQYRKIFAYDMEFKDIKEKINLK